MKNAKKVAKKSAAKRAVKKSEKSAANTALPHINEAGEVMWNLRLYVAGQNIKSLTAYANLKRLCAEYLPDRHTIEVVDLVKQPHLANRDQIIALPTLVRKLPEPIKRVIGDLSNSEKVRISLDLLPLNAGA